MQVEQKLDVVIDALSNEAFMPYLQQYAQYTYEELLVLEREASERAIVLPAAFSRHLFTLKVTNRAGRIKWHDKSLSRFKQQIRILTNRNWGVSMKYQLFKISQYLRG